MTNEAPPHKTCSKCNKSKTVKDGYYLAANDTIHSDNRLGICKLCLEEIADFNKVESFVDVLRQIDRPFIKSLYDTSLTNKNPFGEYMKNIAMRQNRNKTYLDSEFEGTLEHMEVKTSDDLDKKAKLEDKVKFKITSDVLVKWGSGYSESDLYQLEQFYVSMIEGNSITTPQHKEQLKLLCKVNLEQNKALEEKRFSEFKTLNQQYNKILQDSGFRPIDKVSSGEALGIRTFSQIWEEIEKDGFIPKHETVTTQDIVDKTIMYVGNYTHKLLNSQAMSTPPLDTPKVDDNDELQ